MSAAGWWAEPPASGRAEVRERHEANRRLWEQVAATTYAADLERDVAFLRGGGSSLHPIERGILTEHIGPLDGWCEVALHLQCASGLDTLSLLNEGAHRVVGIDIAEQHIRNARARSGALDAPAEWYACDVLDAPASLDSTADLVLAGRGAIGWIQDPSAWMAVAHRVLRPGGWLCLFDDHPSSHLFDADADHLTWSGVDYFQGTFAGTGFSDSFSGYLGTGPAHSVSHDRLWTFSDVISALLSAGLVLRHIGEHPEPYWDAFPQLDPDDVRRVPQTFSLLAQRPA